MHFYGLLQCNSGPIGVTRTSMCKIYFPKEFAMFFSSLDSKTSDLVFEVTWQISGNGLVKTTRYTG